MDRVRSTDGTEIAFACSGRGPALVLIHGSGADHSRWNSVSKRLSERFTVLAMDRRGRGQSGDSPDYALEREFEDAEAVLAAAGPSAFVLGHSFGALVALEAALRVEAVTRLVLYEPAFSVGGKLVYPPGTRERFADLSERVDRETVLTTYFRDLAGLTDDAIAALRSDPSWPARIAAVPTLLREFAEEDYVPDPSRLARLRATTLLLQGETSPLALREMTDWLARHLPDCRKEVLKNQGHVAITTDPELFAATVIRFLEN